MKRKVSISLFVVIAILLLIFFTRGCNQIGPWTRIADGDIVVPKDTLQKWDSLLKLPPKVEYDTVYKDTGSYHVVYQDRPVPVPDTDSTYSIQDSLVTTYFTASHLLLFQAEPGLDNPIINRWSYRYKGPTEIIKTVEKFVPKPMPYEVRVPANGIYAGGFVSGSKYSFSLGPSGSYLKNGWSYDFGAGYQYIFGQEKGSILFSAGIKHKF